MKIHIPEPISAVDYDRRLWISNKEFVFSVEENGIKKDFVCPVGFVLDFYTIPRFLHFWISNRPGWGESSSAIHDFLRRFYKDFGVNVKYSDNVFLEAMKTYELRTRYIKYYSVRSFALITDTGGEGRPGRTVRNSMSRNGDCWKSYRDIVIKENNLL